MADNSPTVSVVMSLFNAQRYLREAVDSILAQTHRDFEFVIIDDGSTDSTPQILLSYTDPRINVIRQENSGLAVALNRGIAASRGQYIARMDGDDRTDPRRLAKQLAFLEQHPAIGIVGTWADIIDADGNVLMRKKELVEPSAIRRTIATYNCFNHGTVMFRRDIFEKAGRYSTTFPESVPVEDYALWLRMLRHCEGANIPEYLYSWRQHSTSTSSSQRQKQGEQFFLVSEIYIKSMIADLEKKAFDRQELAYYYYSLGKMYYHHRRAGYRHFLLKALRLNPLVAPKAYVYLGLSFAGSALADKLRRLRDSLQK